MIKNNKIKNILLAVILFITFNSLFILNGCLAVNNADRVAEKSRSTISGEEDISANNNSEKTVSEDSDRETSVSENENDKDTNAAANEKEQASSKESSSTSPKEDPDSLKNIYQRFIESGKPSILVFSYDADCCPKTQAYYEENNGLAKKILEEYKSNYNVLFVNTGILDKNDINTVIDIAAKNQILGPPAILILDKTGKAYKVIGDPFDEIEIKKVLDGLLDD